MSFGSSGEQGPGQPTSGDRVVGEQGPDHPDAENAASAAASSGEQGPEDPPTPAHGIPTQPAAGEAAQQPPAVAHPSGHGADPRPADPQLAGQESAGQRSADQPSAAGDTDPPTPAQGFSQPSIGEALQPADGVATEPPAAARPAAPPERVDWSAAEVATPGASAVSGPTHPGSSWSESDSPSTSSADSSASPFSDSSATESAQHPGAAPHHQWARPSHTDRTPSGAHQQVLFGSAAPPTQSGAASHSPYAGYATDRHQAASPTGSYSGSTTGQHAQPGSGQFPSFATHVQAQPQRVSGEPKKRSGALVAGVTVLALLVGGGAGAVGGYLVADNAGGGSSTTALDQPKPAQQANTPAPPGSVEAVADKVLPSVVQLQVRGRSSAGEGSGFVISADGLIVTNNHVIEGAADGGQITAVFQDGRTAKAAIVGRDPTSDVAVVRAENIGGLVVAELGRSDDLRVGQAVVAVGSPFELAGTVTSGIVSALQRPTRAGGADGSQATVLDAVQTDAAINPGNSGGPLVNMQGQVIGINSAIYSPGAGSGDAGSVGIGFAIPIDQARRTADEIVKTGKATQTILGVTVRDNPQGIGALINEVSAGGSGEKAGVKKGDIVTRLNDRRIDDADALVAAVRSHAPGTKVTLVIGDGERTIEATLGGQPVDPN
ncbi:trypsin-like peptidase domain-containing protein [Actinokineospora guangxiensis]|uniref:Trypsin-like peptidase domain-containing protein n=1 Tax=Actinokineospora guangxiensis TaxID=1490288 RepID=A0ABW0EM67_9PSEU